MIDTSDLFGDEPTETSHVGSDGATTTTTTTATTSTLTSLPKRVLQPQPKLDVDRLLGERGLPALPSVMSDFKQTKKDEFGKLDDLLSRYEHWAHRLYPKLPFDHVLDRVALLGKKMPVKTHLKKMRISSLDSQLDPQEDLQQGEQQQSEEIEPREATNAQVNDDDFDQVERYDSNTPLDGVTESEPHDQDEEDEAFDQLMAVEQQQEPNARTQVNQIDDAK